MFCWYGRPRENSGGNCLRKLFDLWGHNIDVSNQSVFTLNDSCLYYKEEKKTNIQESITETQRILYHFLLLMMTIHPDQADTYCKHSHMNCSTCVKLLLDVYKIDASIDTQMLKTLHIILVHLVALENGRNPGIDTIDKDRGDIH